MQTTEIDDYGVETKVSTKTTTTAPVSEPAAVKTETKPKVEPEEADEDEMYGEAVEYTKKAESDIVPKVEQQWNLAETLVIFNQSEFVYYDYSKKNSSWQTGDMTDGAIVPEDSACTQVIPEVHGTNEFSALISGGYHNGKAVQDVLAVKFTQEIDNTVSYVNCIQSSFIPALHTSRYMHSQALVKGKTGAWTLLAIGGKSDSATWLSSVESIDLTNYLRPGKTVKDASGKIVAAAQATWQPAASLSHPRANFGVVVVQNSVYIIGGIEGVSQTHHPKMATNVIEKYQPQFDKWVEYTIPNVPSLACFSYAPMPKEGQIAILGGTDGMIMQQDLYIIDFKGDGQCMYQQTNFEFCTAFGKLVYHDKSKKLYNIGGFNSNGASYEFKLGDKDWKDFEHQYKLVSNTIDAELMHNSACYFD